MIYYDGIYRLKPLDTDKIPIRQWTAAWRVRIIDLSFNRPEVQYLRPRVVVAVQTGAGSMKTSCAESLGRRICRDFDLNTEQILWVEQFKENPERYYVATFIQRPYMGPENWDSVTWRPVRPNEISAIKPFIPEIAQIQN